MPPDGETGSMPNTYVGSIDQGTTGTRFMVFDHSGQVVANAYERHEQIYPEPGWVEHDPVEIWENTKSVVTSGLEEAGLEASQLEALGITNQRETTVVWDAETGTPVYNALVWQDRRTTDRVEELEAEDRISSVMRDVRESSAALRHDHVTCPECGHELTPEGEHVESEPEPASADD